MLPPDDFERFVDKIDRPGGDGCWVWTAGRRGGYGDFYTGGKTVRAHRLAYKLWVAPVVGPRAFVCHRCDNPWCVNPEHLFVGTHRDNMRDMVEKGRQAKGLPERATDLLGRRLTPGLGRMLATIIAFEAKHNRPGSISEIAAELQVTRQAAHFHVDGLMRRGLIDSRHEKVPLGIRVLQAGHDALHEAEQVRGRWRARARRAMAAGVDGLTLRQLRVLVAVCDYEREHGRSVTQRELAELLGTAPTAGRENLLALQRKGYLRIEPRMARGIRILDSGWTAYQRSTTPGGCHPFRITAVFCLDARDENDAQSIAERGLRGLWREVRVEAQPVASASEPGREEVVR